MTTPGQPPFTNLPPEGLEGQFTPVLVSSGGGLAAYTAQSGWYTLISARIFFNLRLVLSSLGTLGAGNVTITGLPYNATAKDSNFQAALSVIMNNGQASCTGHIMAHIANGSSIITLSKFATGSKNTVTVADLTATADIAISGLYHL